MRKIDIFVSSRCDVQKERCLADRIIRSIAAEFNLPVTVSYSNWLRRRRRQAETNKQSLSFPGEGPLLCPWFWEHQDFTSEEDCKEHIPNTGQFDLVICILWSRLGAKPAPSLVMPDGSEPKSPTDYEIAWALDETKRTPGFPALRVYRNRSTPIPPLEPKEEREKFLLQCESVREFFAHWGKENTFVEACKDYRDLEQFEDLFREHFHDFLAEQLGVVVRNPPREEHPCETNPLRGKMSELEKALANHAETVYSTLTVDEQGALELIIRQLISLGPAETVIPRAVLYDDLISFPRLNDCQKTGAKGLVDRLIKEGLLSTGTNPSGASTISITHELLVGQWPRLSQFLCRDHAFLQMRDRPDASLKVWLGQGRQSDDLLDSRIGLTVAENLPRNFRSSLNKTQVESVKKSLVNTGQFSRMRAKTGLAVTGALLVIAVAIGAFWWKAEIKSSNKAVDYRKLEQGIAERAENWSNLSEAQRKKTEKEELVETGVDNTTSERNALPPGPEPAGEKAHVAEQNADLAAGQPKPVPIRPVNGGPGVGTEPVNGGPVVGGPGVGTEPVNGGPVVGGPVVGGPVVGTEPSNGSVLDHR